MYAYGEIYARYMDEYTIGEDTKQFLWRNAAGDLLNEIISRFLIKTQSLVVVGHSDNGCRWCSVWLDG